MSESSPDQPAQDETEAPKKDPIRRLTMIAVGVCAFLALWYVIGDRLTPSTNQARSRRVGLPGDWEGDR